MKKDYKFIITIMLALISFNGFGLSILLVNDNGYAPERVDVIKQAITGAGYDFSFYDAASEGSSPSYSLMSNFDLVIWYTGNDGSGLFFWNGNDSDNDNIKQYIDNGGMFWLQGLDFIWDRYKDVPFDFYEDDMLHDYFGISQIVGQSHVDDGLYSDGVPELDVIAGNGIFTMSPVKWTYETMWYVDALNAVENAVPVYRLGPEGYDFYDNYAGIYFEKGNGKVLTFTFETARLDTPENTIALFKEGLDYFKQFGQGEIIHVTGIDVYAEDGATTITENEGTLQMYADVQPDSATNKAVFWSVTPGTAYATINNEGLLQAAGSNIGNGTVWVKATAADGSGIADSIEITISNQVAPEGFNILFVNDNGHTPDRYTKLDTVLMDLNYDYTIFNTVETGTAPDLVTLSKYELVIWYTGNDGVALKLWDISDTNNYKFNAPLIQYINHGGNIWLQGLDFIYDVYGKAPDDFSAGQFVYDYMGIKSYVGQSHVDDEEINLQQLDAVDGNDVCTFTPVKWVYSEGLYYADAYDITPAAKAIYNMGPVGYPLYGKTCALYKKSRGRGTVMTWAFETARIDTYENTKIIFDQTLTWFKNNLGIEENNAFDGEVIKVYPNPAFNTTTISYNLNEKSDVNIAIFDLSGKKVWENSMGTQTQGQHSIQINRNALNLNDGIYFYSISTGNNAVSGKILFK